MVNVTPGNYSAKISATKILRVALVIFFTIIFPSASKSAKKSSRPVEEDGRGIAVLWRDPAGARRDLFYGIGGKGHAPTGESFAFVKEDLDGSNPKFLVQDSAGVKWKVKLGAEAEPEVAASRLVWAAGYFTDEDYFLAKIRVAGVPEKLHRGRELVASDGTMRKVRLKREGEDRKKIGIWKWKEAPFAGTREFNGLRVLMALINNWDVKDENNAVYRAKSGSQAESREEIYLVSDLGASFGTNGIVRGVERSRGNLDSYLTSAFIKKATPDFVDFATPARAPWQVMGKPARYLDRLHLLWIGEKVPRNDAKWMGQLLAQLSPQQIRDAFRAAGFSEADVEGFADTMKYRIGELAAL
ncbi:MAG: hypothetical protein JWO19_576 [Bryobacterales bacterium]|nr:hypothetical protein [Bryobacterales bacterium]